MFHSVNSEQFQTNEALNLEGYTFWGDTYQNKVNQDTKPENAYCNTSSEKSKYRSLYNINTAGPIIYAPTQDDQKQIVNRYPNLIANNPILTKFPWLVPFSNESGNTQDLLQSGVPIYKCLGKGLGTVTFFKSGSASGAPYPFNGYIYAGTLVQLTTEETDDSIRETKVIPYQAGRGIPQPSAYYQPDTIVNTYSPPFGSLVWPDTQEEIIPSLATGVEPGNSNAAIGIVLDTFSSTIPNNRIFPIVHPNGFSQEQLDQDEHDPYYNHPAPHTIPAVSIDTNNTVPNTQGFISPGPNLSGTYYSPWPRYYAYQPNEAIPVLTQGVTTARIGACTNIALMSYGIRQSISATDETWLPVTILALFDGERLEAGSYIYASVKGKIMTPGPFQPIEYPVDTEDAKEQVVSSGVLGQTPWDLYIDSTWGNIGWTSTPGLAFSMIPDQENSVMEVLGGSVIQYLNQANQGSIIVQGVTSVSPSPATGNAYFQSPLEISATNFTAEQIAAIKLQRAQLPGISGRGTLPQNNPEKAQPIGILLETIRGTGRWSYTAQPLEFYIEPNVIGTGGVSYGNPTTINPTNIRTNTGAGVGGTLSWTEFNSNTPFLGTVTGGITYTVPGTQVDGDIVTAIDTSLNWDTNEFQYHGNNAAFVVANGATDLTLQSGGTNYSAGLYTGFNLSLNNIYTDFDESGADLLYNGTLVGVNYYQDFERYAVNTVIRVLYKTAGGYSTQAYFRINQYLTYTLFDLQPFVTSTIYTTVGATFMETEQSNVRTLVGNPEINVLTVGANGEILTFEWNDYGTGNKAGDRIVFINGTVNPGMDTDNNGVIEFPGLPPGYQEIIASAPNYHEDNNPYDTERVDGTPTALQIDVVTDPNQSRLPIVFQTNSGVGIDQLLRMTYTGGYLMATPWYHSNCLSFFGSSAPDNIPWRGGSGYVSDTNVSCYNLTANSLRVLYTISSQVLLAHVTGLPPYDDENYAFETSRYTFSNTNGTQVRILAENTAIEFQQIIQLNSFDSVNGLDVTTLRAGGQYSFADGNTIFQTQRLDQTQPTVDIIVDSTKTPPKVTQVKLRTPGRGNQNGDLILVTQDDSDYNCIFEYQDNMPLIDLPPYANVPGYNVKKDTAAWERYSDIMSSAVNLFDKQVLIELRNVDDQTMEDITPYAVLPGQFAPPTNNIFREDYMNVS
jgi:hypothetical protein